MSSDFYSLMDLNQNAIGILNNVRMIMEEIQPVINKHWIADTFPFEIIPKFQELEIINGPVLMEVARVDPSIATFLLVQSGLAMQSIRELGTEER